MKLMKLFAVLALVGMSNAAFGYTVTFNNRTNNQVQVTFRTAGPVSEWQFPFDLNLAPNEEKSQTLGGDYANRPLQSIHLNGINMNYNVGQVIRDISFDITEDRAGNLNLNEVQ